MGSLNPAEKVCAKALSALSCALCCRNRVACSGAANAGLTDVLPVCPHLCFPCLTCRVRCIHKRRFRAVCEIAIYHAVIALPRFFTARQRLSKRVFAFNYKFAYSCPKLSITVCIFTADFECNGHIALFGSMRMSKNTGRAERRRPEKKRRLPEAINCCSAKFWLRIT